MKFSLFPRKPEGPMVGSLPHVFIQVAVFMALFPILKTLPGTVSVKMGIAFTWYIAGMYFFYKESAKNDYCRVVYAVLIGLLIGTGILVLLKHA